MCGCEWGARSSHTVAATTVSGPEPGQKNHTVFAVSSGLFVADHSVQLPAGFCLVYEGRAPGLPLVGTGGNLPARRVFKEFLNALYADLLHMDEVSYAPEPLDIVFRIEAVLVAPRGLYEAVLFV